MVKSISAEKKEVQEFWNRNVCQAEHVTDVRRGSKDFFERINKLRYKYHYYMPALFDRLKMMKPEAKLLEVGCGMATDLMQLAERGMKVNGIDLTDEGIKLAKERFDLYNLPYESLQVGDAENLPFEDNTFEVVYSFGVLHHTPDTQKSINEVYRVLQSKGLASIMLYNRHSFNYWVHRLLNAPFDGNKKDRCPIERTYSKNEIREMFSEFEDVEIQVKYFITTGYGIIWDIIPKFLHDFFGKNMGWHLVIFATKG